TCIPPLSYETSCSGVTVKLRQRIGNLLMPASVAGCKTGRKMDQRIPTRLRQSWPPKPRGYFAIGAERMSKALNLGNLMRSAHAFGASFTFTIGAMYQALEARADTSKGQWHLPHYNWA